MLVTAVPMGIGLYACGSGYYMYKRQYEALSNKSQTGQKKTVYVANREMKKGEIISTQDLVEVSVFVEEDVFCEISQKEIIGKELKVDISKGVVLHNDLTYGEDKIADDVRLQMYSDIELHTGILEGSMIDIRISFPNGEDYIIAEQKRVQNRDENNLLLMVNEEEILKLSSAVVDKKNYEGAKIYAVLYVEDYQNAAIPDYPVNSYVAEQGNWNPNLIEKVFSEEMVDKRRILEENLRQLTE